MPIIDETASASPPAEPNPPTTSGIRRAPGRLEFIAVALSIAATVPATTNSSTPVTALVRSLDAPTSNGMLSTPTDPPEKSPEIPLSLAQSVQNVHADSGLTWEQLSRIFGVSRRAVHNWASGGRMTARNVGILEALRQRIDRLDADTAARSRELILALGEDGKSLHTHWRDEFSPEMPSTEGTPLTVTESFNAHKSND